MNSIEAVKNSVLGKVLDTLTSVEIPFYQFIPLGSKAPFGSISFVKGEWQNDLPGIHFQAILFFQVEILSDYKGLAELHRLMEQVIQKLDGAMFSVNESAKFWIFYHLTELEGQQHSARHSLRCGSMRFEVRWRGF